MSYNDKWVILYFFIKNPLDNIVVNITFTLSATRILYGFVTVRKLVISQDDTYYRNFYHFLPCPYYFH